LGVEPFVLQAFPGVLVEKFWALQVAGWLDWGCILQKKFVVAVACEGKLLDAAGPAHSSIVQIFLMISYFIFVEQS
jgi:hypothetical protein